MIYLSDLRVQQIPSLKRLGWQAGNIADISQFLDFCSFLSMLLLQ